jgi:hemerythrin HHE cation binding domain-containing protein
MRIWARCPVHALVRGCGLRTLLDRSVKRSDALKALSRQHHQGLVVAMRLKRATTETAGEVREAFLDFWASERQGHFRAEEEVLLPTFAGHAAPDHEAVVRVLVEHVDLRRRSAELAEDGDIRRPTRCASSASVSRATSVTRSGCSSR